MLDKDKLRRHSYVNSGFPYGIPSESDCAEAHHWRARITTGWRVLRSFQLIAERESQTQGRARQRPGTLRRVSGGWKSKRWWQAVSCQYPDCTEHGLKHLLDGRERRESDGSREDKTNPIVDDTKGREAMILERRLALLEQFSDQDLLSYVYLWRLLLWMF